MEFYTEDDFEEKEYTSSVPYGEKQTCIKCGKEYMAFRTIRSRHLCPDCWNKHTAEHEEVLKEYLEKQSILRHEMAIRKIELSKGDFLMSDIQEAVDNVWQMELIKPEAFKSTAEVITAIFLFYESYYYKINHQVLKYYIDFYLPDEKICLEIDGGLHDLGNKRAKDGRRDVQIREYLGKEWETVRVPTKLVYTYPDRISEAMMTLADKQRELRKKYNGMLPENYSKSTKAYYNMVCPDELVRVYKK